MEFVRGDGVGKNDRKITTDNSCFDVYVEYEDSHKQTGGIGIEVKYTEPFSNSDYWGKTGYKKDRYVDAIEKYSSQFSMEYVKEYLQSTYNQLFKRQFPNELYCGGYIFGRRFKMYQYRKQFSKIDKIRKLLYPYFNQPNSPICNKGIRAFARDYVFVHRYLQSLLQL